MIYLALGALVLLLIAAGRWPWMARGLLRLLRPSVPRPDMSLTEARATLGVGEAATRVEIEAAYRRLMLRAHPDQGGSTGLAAQLNAARDRLLRPQQ